MVIIKTTVSLWLTSRPQLTNAICISLLVSLLMTSDIYAHHVVWHCWIPCCRLSCLQTRSHVLSDCIPTKCPYHIYISKWGKGGRNLLGMEAKRNEKSLILFSLTELPVSYMVSEWLCVAAGWAFCPVGWSGLQYFSLCKCSHATLHSVELKAFIITCWTKRRTEHKLKKCHLNKRKIVYGESYLTLKQVAQRVKSLPLEMFRRSPDMVLGNCCSSPCSEQDFGLDCLQFWTGLSPSSLSWSITLRTSPNILLSLRIKYTFGQGKDNDPQIVKNLRVMKGSHTQTKVLINIMGNYKEGLPRKAVLKRTPGKDN